MSKLFIGVDPSINSTGVVIRRVTDGTEEYVHFYIIKNDNHELNKKGELKNPLTKKEQLAQEKNENFQYVLYDKEPIDSKGSSVDNEFRKTVTLFNICHKLKEIINNENRDNCECHACIEGISYGSTVRTSAVFDLAGLNYLLRYALQYICGIDTLIVAPPGHVKKFATGNGSADKDTMVATFEGIIPDLDIPKKDDIADAWFMSRIAEVENLPSCCPS